MTWNTVSVLCMSQLGSSEWEIQNVLAVFQVGSLLVHCPFPCDVLAVFLVGTPLLAPSVSRLRTILHALTSIAVLHPFLNVRSHPRPVVIETKDFASSANAGMDIIDVQLAEHVLSKDRGNVDLAAIRPKLVCQIPAFGKFLAFWSHVESED